MAASSALVPIIVAVIGVVRAVVPAVYVNSLQSRPDPDVTISASTNNPFPGRDFGISYFSIGIGNEAGNALATKLSIILESYSYGEGSSVIYSITNTFSNTNVVLPQYNDTILRARFSHDRKSFTTRNYDSKIVHDDGRPPYFVYVDNVEREQKYRGFTVGRSVT